MVDAGGFIRAIKEKGAVFKGRRQQERDARSSMPSFKEFVQSLPSHIQNAIKITGDFRINAPIDRIIIAGAGVHAIAGDLVRTYLAEQKLDISVSREFTVPDSLNERTLVCVASYSGNDPEPLSCYKTALRKGCRTIGITSGGRLLEAMARGGSERILLPSNLPESSILLYIFVPLIKVLENSRLIRPQSAIISETINALRKSELLEMSKHLYDKLTDKIPIIYCSPTYGPVAEYWKYQFNVTAKVPAFFNVFSDAAYSDLAGYAKDVWDFYTIFLNDQEDNDDIQKSMAAARKIIKNQGHGCTEIMMKGTNLMARMLSAVVIADHTAIHLSDYYRIDIDLVEQYKRESRAV